jgi:cytochrome P450
LHFRIAHPRVLFVNHPDLIQECLVSKAKSFVKYQPLLELFRQIDGEGLIVTESDFWRRQLQGAFNPKRFDRYAKATVAKTREMLSRWRAEGRAGLRLSVYHASGRAIF